MGHAYVSTIIGFEVYDVEGCKQPEVEAGYPNQQRVLETWRQVWLVCLPRPVPILQKRTKERFIPSQVFKDSFEET